MRSMRAPRANGSVLRSSGGEGLRRASAPSSARETWVASESSDVRRSSRNPSGVATTRAPRISSRIKSGRKSTMPFVSSSSESWIEGGSDAHGRTRLTPSIGPIQPAASSGTAREAAAPVETVVSPSGETSRTRTAAPGPTTSEAAVTTAALTCSWPAAATSATPARRSASSRLVARSSWRTSPAMRATTRRNRAADAPMTTSTSMLWMSCAK